MFNKKTYFSIHNHTDYSNNKFPDSINKISELIDRAYEIGLTGVAITDHDCVSSYVQAEKYVLKKKKENPDDEQWQNFKFVFGNEIYLCKNGLTKETYEKGVDRYYHFILLAKDSIGNQQIRELSTRAWKRSYMYFHRRVPTYFSDLDEVVLQNPGHLIASSACLGGQIPTLILRKKEFPVNSEEAARFDDAVVRLTQKYQQLFGADFYYELQPGLTEEQIHVNKALIDYGKRLGVKCIVTTDSHYLRAEDRPIHKSYLNSKEGDREVDAFYEAAYMMTAEEIEGRLSNYLNQDIINELFQNTIEVANKCGNYSILKGLELPYIPRKEQDQVLNAYWDYDDTVYKNVDKFVTSNEPADVQLITRIWNFLNLPSTHGDLLDNLKVVDHELGIVWDSSKRSNVCWSKYFLQVADYCDLIWNVGDSILAPSRGSAGASYIMYCLGIIQIDKTREKAPLIFERFINPDRASVLDVDIDVESTKRNQIIKVIENTYGSDRVIRVATFRTEKARSAILNAGRGLGMDVDVTRYIASLVKSERGIQYSLQEVYYGDEEKDIKPNPTFVAEMDKNPELWEVAQRIEGLVCGNGIHAGGIIISEKPIVESAAIMTTTKGEAITSFDLHDLEAVSLIKIDLLATESLSKIRTCLDLLIEYKQIEKKPTLRETYEHVIGIYNLERDDQSMWSMVWNNEIISLFQMEQQSGIQGISMTKPSSLEDLATLNSVIRLMAPEKGMEQPLQKYKRFRDDPLAWDVEMQQAGLTEEEMALLHSMLDYSNGIAATQEDLYHFLTHPTIAGMSLGDADVLRKAVAKKSPKDYEAFGERFWKNVEEKQLSKNLCSYVWDTLIATQRG